MRVKDARQTFLGIWIKCLIEGAPIQVFGDGSQVRDFNFVDDVVDAMLETAVNPAAPGEVFNLGSAEVVTLKNLAETLVSLNGAGTFEIVPFPKERKVIDIGDYYSDFSKINAKLGWFPKISLRDGLARTLSFYRQYGEHY